MITKSIDLTGMKFGRWLAVKNLGLVNSKKYYLCVCDCGIERNIPHGDLRSGKSRSCGCLRSELRIKKNTTHGKRNTRLFSIWSNMKTRCYNPNATHYKSYGEKGVRLCKEWLDFQSFYDWAMKNGYSDDLSIDRIDVNGNYEPRNCRWASSKTQSNNKTSNHYVQLNGELKTLNEWSIEFGVNYHTVQDRIRRGWSDEKALITPVGG